MATWDSVWHMVLSLSGLRGSGNQDARQHSSSIFSVPVIPLTSSFQPHTPHVEDVPILQTRTWRLRGCWDPLGATQLLNGGAGLEPSLWGCRAGVLPRSSVLLVAAKPGGRVDSCFVPERHPDFTGFSRGPGCQNAGEGLGLAARERSESLGSWIQAQPCQWGCWDLGGTCGTLGAPAWVFCSGLVVLPEHVAGVRVFGCWIVCGGGAVGGKEPGRSCSVPAEGPGCALSAVALVCGPASPAPPSGCPWDSRHRGSGSVWKVRARAGGGACSELSVRGLAVPICGKCSACPCLRSLSPRVGRSLSLCLSNSLHLSLSLSLCLLHPSPSLFSSLHLRTLSSHTREHTHAHTHTPVSR